jgi:hypothetical protein
METQLSQIMFVLSVLGIRLTLQLRIGKFNLYAHDEQTFWIEDIHYPVIFQKGEEGNLRKVIPNVNAEKWVTEVIAYY